MHLAKITSPTGTRRRAPNTLHVSGFYMLYIVVALIVSIFFTLTIKLRWFSILSVFSVDRYQINIIRTFEVVAQ